MSGWVLGVIGGSGLYALDELEDARTEQIATPWGFPSAALVRGRIGDVSLVFLSRHGSGHIFSPSGINYRANIDALKRVGCTDIISVSAVGSLKESFSPGDFVVPDQYIDRTVGRVGSFFGDGCVAHVSMADPVCSRLSGLLSASAMELGFSLHDGATALVIDGPQFSSRAESHLYRSWGCEVIGMTNMPEAKLCREAEMPYASLCMVSDYDCWRPRDEADASQILSGLQQSVIKARSLLRAMVLSLPAERSLSPSRIERVLDTAIVTSSSARDFELVSKLDAVAGRVLSP